MRASLGVLFALALAGCQNEKPGGTPVATSGGGLGSADEAKHIYLTRCATCHSVDGSGNGPGAANFTVRPRSFQDAEWQRSVTDDSLRKISVEGGEAVGKSSLMPPNADLRGRTITLDALVLKIRGFAR